MDEINELKFPIVITGRRKLLLKWRLSRLWNAILVGATLGILVSWLAGKMVLLNWILFFSFGPVFLLLLAMFRPLRPRLRLEADAFYVETDGGKIAHDWSDIGPVRHTTSFNGQLIWWRSIGAEIAAGSKGRDLEKFSLAADETCSELFFTDSATEAAAFVATMNRCRAEALSREVGATAGNQNVPVAVG